jgi:hypothetical protein
VKSCLQSLLADGQWAFLLVFLGSGAYVASAGSSVFMVAVALVSEAGSRPAATRFLLSCQKKPGKEKARLAGGLSGGTHCAPASLRSNSRRKSEGLPRTGRDACARSYVFMPS